MEQALTRVMIDSDDDSVQSEEDEENAQGAEQVCFLNLPM